MNTSLNPQIIGRAENAHKPLMALALAGTGTTFPQWVALRLVATGTTFGLADEVAVALKIPAADIVAGMVADGLLTPQESLTEAGRARYDEIRSTVDAIVARVYADIPAEDLEVAGRVLTTITARADAEAAAHPA
jgi:hypothetical protein